MEHIRSFRTGIMAEYLVMSTSQGTYGRIEQTLYVIRETYEMCRGGGEDWDWETLVYVNQHCLVQTLQPCSWGPTILKSLATSLIKHTWSGQSSSSRLLENCRQVCWSRLEINFPGEWVPRSRVEDLWSSVNQYSSIYLGISCKFWFKCFLKVCLLKSQQSSIPPQSCSGSIVVQNAHFSWSNPFLMDTIKFRPTFHLVIYFCPCLNPKYLVVWKYNGLRMSFLCWLQPRVLTTTEDLKWLWMKWANSENRMFESTKPVPALKCTPRPLQWNRTILALNRITLTLVWESSLHPGRGSCAKAAINTGASQ